MIQYVTEMRKLIGNKPLIVCGASVILFDRDHRVLMLRRSDNGSWCFPGGALDLGENTEDTARREVTEETGLHVAELTLFGVFSGEELHYIYPNGDEVYTMDVVYQSSSFSGEIVLNDESLAYEFFEIRSLPDDISPPVIPVVKKLKEQYHDIGGKRT